MGADNHATTVPHDAKKDSAESALKDAGVRGVISIEHSDDRQGVLFGHVEERDGNLEVTASNLPNGWAITEMEREGSTLWVAVGPV